VIPDRTLALLREVAAGTLAPEAAVERLAVAPFEELSEAGSDRPFATIDHHRAVRQGWPEVIYGEGKSPGQCVAIGAHIAAQGDGFLLTRASADTLTAVERHFPGAIVNPTARTARLPAATPAHRPALGTACIVAAGTTDLPVADECAETLVACGATVDRISDVGVAGVHRVLARVGALRSADVLVVVAGMDGALPSVVGGLVARPVIAVPTSVGYGAAFGGIAALLAMLNSCAAGVSVVNIDNGFGAGMAAARILAGRTSSGT
jgi:hypothetical protein